MARVRKRNQKKDQHSRWSRPVRQAFWGYFFTLPFFAAFFIFFFIPIVDTVRNSFYEYYTVGLMEVGPNFIGVDNYVSLLETDMLKYALNTIILWLGAFIPQLILSILLASWLTDLKLMIFGREFFRVVIYMPGVIMASAWAVLFFTIFSNSGAVNFLLMSMGLTDAPIEFFSSVTGTRFLICFLLFLMNFGNTTLLIMAAVSGLPDSLFDSAFIDGCSYTKAFIRIVIPAIKPVFAYIFITSLIMGLQMFDIPQILTNGNGNPDRTSMTLIMYLNRHLSSDNYGLAGALSVYLFVVSGVLCFFIYKLLDPDDDHDKRRKRRNAN